MDQMDWRVDSSIYENRQYLRDSNSPDKIVGRDDELTDYKNALLPVINDEEPNNIFVYGKTGVGKTACTEFILNDLQEASQERFGVDVTVLTINCEGHNTSYSVAIDLINKMRPMDEQISESGYKEKRVYSMLFEELDKIGGTVIIVLDELDSLDHNKMDGLLYQLPRARSTGNLTEAKVGIIGISSDLTLRDKLRPDVQSSLCEKSIHFDPYDSGELQAVLEQRAENAFYEDALKPGVLSLCSARGAQDGGDARRAIGLLREAGDMAREENGTEAVTTDHVEEASEKLRANKIITSISNLSINEQITLYALATLYCEDEEKPRTRRIHERYQTIAENAHINTVTIRQVRDYLSDFDNLQITRAQGVRGGANGNYRTHTFNTDVDVNAVMGALDEAINLCGVHESVAHLESIQHHLEEDTI